MDNLARDAVAATSAGMSYGFWKALHPNTKDVIEEVVRLCEYCGKQLPRKKNVRFCDDYCQRAKARERYEERRKNG